LIPSKPKGKHQARRKFDYLEQTRKPSQINDGKGEQNNNKQNKQISNHRTDRLTSWIEETRRKGEGETLLLHHEHQPEKEDAEIRMGMCPSNGTCGDNRAAVQRIEQAFCLVGPSHNNCDCVSL
jgi:hypothetical protein